MKSSATIRMQLTSNLSNAMLEQLLRNHLLTAVNGKLRLTCNQQYSVQKVAVRGLSASIMCFQHTVKKRAQLAVVEQGLSQQWSL